MLLCRTPWIKIRKKWNFPRSHCLSPATMGRPFWLKKNVKKTLIILCTRYSIFSPLCATSDLMKRSFVFYNTSVSNRKKSPPLVPRGNDELNLGRKLPRLWIHGRPHETWSAESILCVHLHNLHTYICTKPRSSSSPGAEVQMQIFQVKGD